MLHRMAAGAATLKWEEIFVLSASSTMGFTHGYSRGFPRRGKEVGFQTMHHNQF
jgi:hypothetical protein